MTDSTALSGFSDEQLETELKQRRDSRTRFDDYLKHAHATVAKWPAWKRNILGRALTEDGTRKPQS